MALTRIKLNQITQPLDQDLNVPNLSANGTIDALAVEVGANTGMQALIFNDVIRVTDNANTATETTIMFDSISTSAIQASGGISADGTLYVGADARIGNATNISNAGANSLQVGNTGGSRGITILSANTGASSIYFADNQNNDAGYISYNHAVDGLFISTNRGTALGISSSGDLSVAGDLTVNGDFTVSGNTTYVNSNNLEVEDLNIVLGAGANTTSAIDGSGLTFGDDLRHLTYTYYGDYFSLDATLMIDETSTLADTDGASYSPLIFKQPLTTGDSTLNFKVKRDVAGSDTDGVVYQIQKDSDGGYLTLGADVNHGTWDLPVLMGKGTNHDFGIDYYGRVHIGVPLVNGTTTLLPTNTLNITNTDPTIGFIDGLGGLGAGVKFAEIDANNGNLVLSADRLDNVANTVIGFDIDNSRVLTIDEAKIVSTALEQVWIDLTGGTNRTNATDWLTNDNSALNIKIDSTADYTTPSSWGGIKFRDQGWGSPVASIGVSAWHGDGTEKGYGEKMSFFIKNSGVADSYNEVMTLRKGGNVGINTASPSSRLHVKEAMTMGANAQSILVENTTTGNPVAIAMRSVAVNGGVGNTGAIYFDAGEDGSAANNKLAFNADHQTDNNYDMVLTGDGKVGIATSTPTHLLDVHKTDATQYDRSAIPTDGSGATIRIINNDLANGPSYAGIHLEAFGASSNTSRGFIGMVNDENWTNGGWSGTHGHLAFATRGSSFGTVRETMILTTDGNLGIGEDWGDLANKRPMHKLDVDGAIATRQVRHNIRPTLNLDFANSKTLDSRITFSRNSIATYCDEKGVIRYANPNQPRFNHDPVTGESKGLLVEKYTTNLVQYENNPEMWTFTGYGTLTALGNHVQTLIDGLSVRSMIFDNYSGTQSRRGPNTVSASAGARYCTSFYVKNISDGDFISFYLGAASVPFNGLAGGVFNFTTGEWSSSTFTNAQVSSSLSGAEELTDGWWRLWLVATAFTTDTWTPVWVSSTTSAKPEIAVFGLQVEESDYPTSYIPSDTKFVSRSSLATYHDKDGILRIAPNGTPRYGYTYNGREWVETGLILEKSVTAGFPSASAGAYDLGPHYQNGLTADRTNTEVTAPDGTNLCTKLTSTTTSARCDSYTQMYTYDVPNVLSVYAKAGTEDYFTMGFGDNGDQLVVGFNLASEEASNSAGRIQKIGTTGWYRCSVVFTPTDTASGPFGYIITLNTGTMYFWGILTEKNTTFPSSFIYFDGTTITRAADVYTSASGVRRGDHVTIHKDRFLDFYDQYQGTWYAEADTVAEVSSSANRIDTIRVSKGWDTNNSYYMGPNSVGGSGLLYIYSTNGGAGDISLSPANTDKEYKFAFAYAVNDTAASVNGSTPVTDTDANLTIGVDRVDFGSRGASDQYQNGHIRKISYYNQRLPNDELQALTENN